MGKKEKEPQEVVIKWGGDLEQRHAILYSGLFQVAAQLTQICHPNGGKPDEVVDTFTQVYALLHEWYKGSDFKVEIKRMLEILLPDGPGGGDEQTLTTREIDVAGFRPRQASPK
jgi:hypothetical protein